MIFEDFAKGGPLEKSSKIAQFSPFRMVPPLENPPRSFWYITVPGNKVEPNIEISKNF